jgi:hypothetical protein
MGFPQSHGNVNMTIGNAYWVFDWTNLGYWFFVCELSGKTPTDPNRFTSGG